MKMLVFVRSEPLGNGNLTGDTMGLVAGFVINIQIGLPSCTFSGSTTGV